MRKVLCLMLIAIMLLSVGCSAAVSVVGANINDSGNLILSMSDGSTIDAGYAKGDKGDQGEKGIDGKDGRDGIDGVDGVGIKKAAVNDSGHLMIRLTDDTLMDTGYVIGADGKDGRDGVDGRDGRDGADGRDGVDGSNGIDGKTPYIGDNGNWWIGEEDTGVKAKTTDFIFNDNGNGTLLLAYVGHDTDVVIPEKATRICEGAFMNNRVISTVEIPDNVTTINESAFENCTSLKEVILPDGLSALGANAFSNCDSLEKAYIPYRLVISDEWDYGTFAYNDSLKSITWGNATGTDNNGMIPSDTFQGCFNLVSVTIPDYVYRIADGAFARTGISGDLVLACSIGNESFAYCDNITSVIVKMYDTTLGNSAFRCCEKLQKVEFVIPNDTVIEGGFEGENGVPTTAHFSIGRNTFSGCNNLETVVFDIKSTCIFDNLTLNVDWSIEDGAFIGTKTSGIRLPTGLTRLGSNVFGACEYITIYVDAPTPPSIKDDLFVGSFVENIYVPAASVDAYKAADGWKDYADKIRALS